MSAPASERVQVEWARRVGAEYASAGVTAQVLTWAIQAGLPPEWVYRCHRVVHDELEHARLSHEVLAAAGGGELPVELQADELTVAGGLVPVLVRNLCLGESFAVPCFERMRRRATHPVARAVLDRILVDEAEHRKLGWDGLDVLLAADPRVRPVVEAELPALLGSFSGYAAPPEAPALTADERAWGLLEHAEYGEVYAASWVEDVAPRFERRGIRAPVR